MCQQRASMTRTNTIKKVMNSMVLSITKVLRKSTYIILIKFFDKILFTKNTRSCLFCLQPERHFTTDKKFSHSILDEFISI